MPHRTGASPAPPAALYLTLLLPLVLATGCGLGPAVRDDDVDAFPVLAAEEDLRIGSVNDPELGFSRVVAVDVDRDGNIYVGEAQDVQIRVYSPDGRPLHRIGRRGGGPGEFQMLPQFGVMGDTLWTYDISAGRITLFDRAGNVLSTGPTHGVAIPLREGRGYVTPLRMRADGLFTSDLRRVAFNPNDPPSGIGPNDPIPVPRVLFDATGTVVDTLAWDPSPSPRMVPPPGSETGRFRNVTVGSRPYMVPDPPTELPFWIPLDDGRIVIHGPPPDGADDASFTVTRLDLNEDTVWHRQLSYTPVRFDEATLDSAAARSARGANVISGGPGPPPAQEQEVAARQIRAAMRFPEYQPAVAFGWLGQDGSIWLPRQDRQPGSTALWIVLDAEGQGRGVVELPRGGRPLWSGGDVFWATVPDEFDVPWIVRYRVGRTVY